MMRRRVYDWSELPKSKDSERRRCGRIRVDRFCDGSLAFALAGLEVQIEVIV
jgi:hypothetical protein